MTRMNLLLKNKFYIHFELDYKLKLFIVKYLFLEFLIVILLLVIYHML